jgi:hypothetical protein
MTPLHAAPRRRAVVATCFGVLAALAAACSSTMLRDSWRDPQFAGPPLRSVLVIGVARSQHHRRIFEDGFTQALRSQEIAGTASYPLLPEEGALGNARIKQAVAQAGADAVLVTRVLRISRNVTVNPGYVAPGYAMGFYGWYATTWTAVPPSVDQSDVLTIESTLWDMRQEKAVWSGTSESTDPKDVSVLTGALARVLIARMKDDKVLVSVR